MPSSGRSSLDSRPALGRFSRELPCLREPQGEEAPLDPQVAPRGKHPLAPRNAATRLDRPPLPQPSGPGVPYIPWRRRRDGTGLPSEALHRRIGDLVRDQGEVRRGNIALAPFGRGSPGAPPSLWIHPRQRESLELHRAPPGARLALREESSRESLRSGL